MLMKNDRIIFFVLLIVLSFVNTKSYSQCEKTEPTFYIKFDFKQFKNSGSILNENYIERRNQGNNIVFIKGIETIAIDRFIFDMGKYKTKILSQHELNKISFNPVTDLNNISSKKVMICVVEITEDDKIVLYPNVKWERTVYIE